MGFWKRLLCFSLTVEFSEIENMGMFFFPFFKKRKENRVVFTPLCPAFSLSLVPALRHACESGPQWNFPSIFKMENIHSSPPPPQRYVGLRNRRGLYRGPEEMETWGRVCARVACAPLHPLPCLLPPRLRCLFPKSLSRSFSTWRDAPFSSTPRVCVCVEMLL